MGHVEFVEELWGVGEARTSGSSAGPGTPPLSPGDSMHSDKAGGSCVDLGISPG
jgi:hypothetical protein